MRELSPIRPRRYPLSEAAKKEKMSNEYKAVVSNATTYPNMDAYGHYRSMMMVASLPDEPQMAPASYTKDNPFTAAYTPIERDMIDNAARLCGYEVKQISNSYSQEPEHVNKNSPVNHNGGKHRE